ncbi:hypothetical protein D9M68_934720 [compost metagenome]
MAVAIEADVDAVVDEAFGMKAGADLGAVHQVDGALLQDPCPDAAQDIVWALALEDDGVDAGEFEQASEHQARWPGADNDNIGAQSVPPLLPSSSAFRRIGEWTG